MSEDVYYSIHEFIYSLFAKFDSFVFNSVDFNIYAPFIVTISALVFLAVLIIAFYVLYKLLGGLFNVLR